MAKGDFISGEVTGIKELKEFAEALQRVEKKLNTLGGSLGDQLRSNRVYLAPMTERGGELAEKIHNFQQGNGELEAVEFIVDLIISELEG